MTFSEEWKRDQALRMAEIAIGSLEYMSVGEMLEGVPEWDNLFENGGTAEEIAEADRIQEELFNLIMDVEVSLPTIEQRYKET